MRRARFDETNLRVAAGLAIEQVSCKVVHLEFAARGQQRRLCLAHFHLAHHAAADTEIGAGAIPARRLNDEDGLGQLHIF